MTLIERLLRIDANVKTLIAERDALAEKLDTAIQSSAHWQHKFTELQAKLVTLEADAERYRWWCTPGNDIWSDDTKNKETIDAAIDAAKGGQQ